MALNAEEHVDVDLGVDTEMVNGFRFGNMFRYILLY